MKTPSPSEWDKDPRSLRSMRDAWRKQSVEERQLLKTFRDEPQFRMLDGEELPPLKNRNGITVRDSIKYRRRLQLAKAFREEAPVFGQTVRMAKRCGGLQTLAAMAGVYPHTVISWLSNNRKHYGLIPMPRLVMILKSARLFGVVFRIDDLYPELTDANSDVVTLIGLEDLDITEIEEWIEQNNKTPGA